MKKLFNKQSIVSGFGVLVFILACGAFAQTFAQNQYAIKQAQQAVSDKIIRDKGGYVDFILANAPETFYISSSKTGVKGYGTWMKNLYSSPQDFSYEARVDNRRGTVDSIKYKLLSDRNDNGRIPNWAIGTFYGKNPQTGGTITLAISNNGSVIVTFENGATNYANISGDRLTNNGAVSRVTRINNGIRTTRIDNGEAIDYFISRNGNGNGNSGNVPDWAIGTFYARNPQTGGNIGLTIRTDGSVVIDFDGRTSYATIYNDRLTNNGVISRVTKIRNGIRTTRIDNGEVIDYYENGNTNGDGNDNRKGYVPSWALGTFYAQNPQTNGDITLTINADGTVEIDFDGNTTTYATIYKDQLTNNGVVSKVTRINNGIRTTRLDNGERIDYRRR